jgi:adhesin/invasin
MRHSHWSRWAVGAIVLLAAGCDARTELDNLPPSLALSNTNITPVGTIGGAPVAENVTIVNGTDGTLENLTVEIVYQGAPTGWLTAVLDRTTATREQAATLRVTATPGALGLGIYLASIRVGAAGAGNGPLVVAVRFSVEPRPPSKLAVVTEPSATAANGAQFGRQPVVQLLDATDQPARKAGVAVTATIATGGGQLIGAASVLSDANGRATFTDLGVLGTVGPRTLDFSAPNVAAVTSAAIALTAGAATRLEAASAASQTADAGTAVTAAPTVKVVDQSGNGVSGVAVQFVVSSGGTITPSAGLVTGSAGTTGPATWTLNQVAGANTVTATVNGLTGSPVTFTATGRAGPLTQLVKQSGDNLIGLVGTALGTPHVVKAADQFGNGVSGVTIGWTVSGGGSTNPTSSTTGAAGLAQTVRTLPGTAGQGTTTATATGPNGPLTAVFSVTAANAGPAQIVKVSGDGQTAPVSSTLANPIRVQVLDPLGDGVGNVTVSFTTPDGGSFPGGASIQTDGNGFAQTTWRLGSTAGQQAAQAAVGGPAPATFTATGTAGPLNLAQSSIQASPGTITAGGSGSTITVTARDGSGNPLSGLTVTLANTGGGTLVQPSAPTNAQGQATGSYTSTGSGSKTVSATIGGQALPTTATVTVSAAAPASLTAVSATGFAVRFGQAVATLPSVRVQDQFGNGVPGVTVSFGITSGQSTRSPASVATNASGTASLNSWLIGAFTGAGAPQNVYNRISASVAAAVTGNPVVFTGTATVSYATDLYPYLNGTCTGLGCHSNNNPIMATTAANLYSTLLNTANQRYVIPSDTTSADLTRNLLWRKPATAGVTHTGGQFAAEIVTVIKAWIRQGAPNN